MTRRVRTNPDVTLSMNCGAVFRPSLQTGRMVQTRQLAPERFTSRQPYDYPAAPVPPPAVAAQAIEVLEVDV